MAILKSFISALSTYSKIPMPNVTYRENEGRFTLCFFPVVGLFIGAFLYLWYQLFLYVSLPDTAFNIGVLLIPVIVTGGIHIDGFMDSMDAIHSYKSAEERLEILKDPHIGAFSVIKLIELIGFWALGLTMLSAGTYILFIAGFVISRIESALLIQKLETAKASGMVHYTKKHSSPACTAVLVIELIALVALLLLFFARIASLPILVSFLCCFIYAKKSKKDFGGITGDTAGCFLVMTETAWLLSIAFLSI